MIRIAVMRNLATWRAIGVVLVVLVSLVGLTSQTEAQPKQTYKIRYAYIPNANTALFTIGLEKGIFKDLGLDMEMTRFNSGPAQFAALKSGAIDVAEMSNMTFLQGRAQGIDAMAFSLVGDTSQQNILVAQRDSGIKSAKDLKGKKVTAVQGSASYYGLMACLSKNGMTLKDIDFISMDGGAITPAFINKNVDAAWHWCPWNLKMMEVGGVPVMNNKELGALAYQVIIGQTEWLKRNAEAAKLFVEFQERVKKAISDDPNLLLKLTAEVLSLSNKMAAQVIDLNIFVWPEDMASEKSIYSLVKGYEDGSVGLGALFKNTAEFQVSQGMIKAAPDLKTAIDSGPIKAWKASRK